MKKQPTTADLKELRPAPPKSRVEQLQEELDRLREEERSAAEEKLKQQCKLFDALPWEWRVTGVPLVIGGTWCQVAHLFPSLPKGAVVDAVRVDRRKSGYDPEVHGTRQDAERWDGMTYLRTEEGILYHEGGGTYVLCTPLLITQDQWDALRRGDIPEKFKRP